MDNEIKIKVENEAREDIDEESYEEFTISYNCKEEDSADYEDYLVDDTSNPQQQEDKQVSSNDTKKVVPNCHNKKTIVNHFETCGWTSKSYRDLLKKMPPAIVEAYTNEGVRRAIVDAQQYVHQECESLCFSNISDWLEMFKARNVPQNSFYEPAIVMNAIANNEVLPAPEAMGGIDLKAIYSFLCNGLMGLPQKQLDPTSAKFLANEFESLIDEANSDVADSHTLLMKQKLERSLRQNEDRATPSLDPLWLTEDTLVHNDILDTKRNTDQ